MSIEIKVSKAAQLSGSGTDDGLFVELGWDGSTDIRRTATVKRSKTNGWFEWNEKQSFGDMDNPPKALVVKVHAPGKDGGKHTTVATGGWDLKDLMRRVPLEHWLVLEHKDENDKWHTRGAIHLRAFSDTVGKPIPPPPSEFAEFPILSIVELKGLKTGLDFLNECKGQVLNYMTAAGGISLPCVRILEQHLEKPTASGKTVRQQLQGLHPKKHCMEVWPMKLKNIRLLSNGAPLPAAGVLVQLIDVGKPAWNGVKTPVVAHKVTRSGVECVVVRVDGEELPIYPANVKVVPLDVGTRIELCGALKMAGLKGKIKTVDGGDAQPVYVVELDRGDMVKGVRGINAKQVDAREPEKKEAKKEDMQTPVAGVTATKSPMLTFDRSRPDTSDAAVSPDANAKKQPRRESNQSAATGLTIPRSPAVPANASASTEFGKHLSAQGFNTSTTRTPEVGPINPAAGLPPTTPQRGARASDAEGIPAVSSSKLATPRSAFQQSAGGESNAMHTSPTLPPSAAHATYNPPFIVREARGRSPARRQDDGGGGGGSAAPASAAGRPGREAATPLLPPGDRTKDAVLGLKFMLPRELAQIPAMRMVLGGDRAIFYAGYCQKYHAKGGGRFSSKRVVFVTHNTIGLCNPKDGTVTRGMFIPDISEALYTSEGHLALLCPLQQFDLLVKFEGPDEKDTKKAGAAGAKNGVHAFLEKVKVIYEKTKSRDGKEDRKLRVKKISEEDIKGRCKLSKPEGWTAALDVPKWRTRLDRSMSPAVRAAHGLASPRAGGPASPVRAAGSSHIGFAPPHATPSASRTPYVVSDDEDDKVQPKSVRRSRLASPTPTGTGGGGGIGGSGITPTDFALQMQDLKHQMMMQQLQLQQQILAATAKQQPPPRSPTSPAPTPAERPAAAAQVVGGDAGGDPTASEYRQRILALYEIHDPSKTQTQIQLVLEQFAGHERDLYETLVQRVRLGKDAPDEPGTQQASGEPGTPNLQASAAAGAAAAAAPESPASPQTHGHVAGGFGAYRMPAVEPRIALPGACRALLIGCEDVVVTFGDWLNGQYAPQVRALTSPALMQRSNVLNGLRWLGEGARDGDVLVLLFCGDVSEHGLRLPDRHEIATADINAALIATLPASARLFVLLDTHPPGSILSLPHRLAADGERTAGLPGDAYAADVVVVNAVGGANPSPGALTSAFLRVLQHTPQPTHSLLLCEMHRELLRDPDAPAPIIQSSRPARNAAVFGVHGYPDDAPPTPTRQTPGSPAEPDPTFDAASRASSTSDDSAVNNAAVDLFLQSHRTVPPAYNALPTGTGTGTVPPESTSSSALFSNVPPHMLDVVRETFSQATDPEHPNHATAAGTIGCWLMDGQFGLPKDDAMAMQFLTTAASAGDGPSIARVQELGQETHHPVSPKLLQTMTWTGTFSRTPDGGLRAGRRTSMTPRALAPLDQSASYADPHGDTAAAVRLRTAMATNYAAHAPHLLGTVSARVEAYAGRERELLTALRAEHAEWVWPSDDELEQSLLQGGMGDAHPLRVDMEVTIASDINKVRYEFDRTDTLAFDVATMGEYLGAAGVVVAVDAEGAARVRFMDGRVLWWPAAVCVPHQQSFIGAQSLFNLHLNLNGSEVASEFSVEHSPESVVRVTLSAAPADPADFAERVADKMRIAREDVQVLPVDDGPTGLRLRFAQGGKLANEFVARCKNRCDPIPSDLGILKAEGMPEAVAVSPTLMSTASQRRVSNIGLALLSAPNQSIATTLPGSMPVAQTPTTGVMDGSLRSGLPRPVSVNNASKLGLKHGTASVYSKSVTGGSFVGGSPRLLTPHGGVESTPGKPQFGAGEGDTSTPMIGDPPSFFSRRSMDRSVDDEAKQAAAAAADARHTQQEMALLELRTQLDELKRTVSPEPRAGERKYSALAMQGMSPPRAGRKPRGRQPAAAHKPSPSPKRSALRSGSAGSARGRTTPSPRVKGAVQPTRQQAAKKSLTDLTNKLYGVGASPVQADGRDKDVEWSLMTDNERRREEERARHRRMYELEKQQYRPPARAGGKLGGYAAGTTSPLRARLADIDAGAVLPVRPVAQRGGMVRGVAGGEVAGPRVSPPRPRVGEDAGMREREHPVPATSPPVLDLALATPVPREADAPTVAHTLDAHPAPVASAATPSDNPQTLAHPNLFLMRQREAQRRH